MMTPNEREPMDARQVAEQLEITDYIGSIEPGWEQSQETAAAAMPHMLAPDFVETACEAACISSQYRPAVLAAAAEISRNEAASALARYAWYWLHGTQYDGARIRALPRLTHSLGASGGLLYLIALISGFERMQEVHRRHAIPEDVVRDTLSQIDLYFRETIAEQGYPEVVPHLVAWLMNHYQGIIYRLARLQFQFGDNRYSIRVFRNRQTNEVLALSEDGVRFRPDGQVLRPGDDCEGSWEAQLSVADGVAQGNPILPQGRALTDQVRLSLDEWQQVLAPGDPVLHLHIPGGEPMAYDACGEAFRQALEFFPRHFPEYRFNAFMCGSWILDTALQEIAAETSNMVRFQREVYLFPIGLRDDSLPSGLFGGLLRKMPEDLSQAPRDTSLQRAYLDARGSGGLVSGGGGCFLLPEDVDWGAQVYVRQPGHRE